MFWFVECYSLIQRQDAPVVEHNIIIIMHWAFVGEGGQTLWHIILIYLYVGNIDNKFGAEENIF